MHSPGRVYLTRVSFTSRQDIVFCRRYRGLYNLIKPYEDEGRLHCQVAYWTGAWEAEELLDQL